MDGYRETCSSVKFDFLSIYDTFPTMKNDSFIALKKKLNKKLHPLLKLPKIGTRYFKDSYLETEEIFFVNFYIV